ncbi:polysaccharide biosynthesis/export family protein [Variovorax rhizosphaerae]|uniref:Polysaccharide biosynthesis/export family protein n=1 Tax=Variovorax rhizosphaerae TaxID=1836200 RepID=A0ABU8WK34_9BURK
MAAATTTGSAPQPDADYTFSPGDEFDLRVPDAPQLDQSLRVLPDGTVSLPLMGLVRFQGRSVDEVQKDLRTRLDKLAGEAPNRDYLLRRNDELEIKFPFAVMLNDVVRLRPDGKIQLQLVGMVRAEGRSPEELAQDLRTRYATYLRNPDLAVIVRSVNSQSVRTANGVGRAGLQGLRPTIVVRSFQPAQVFVGGEVARPGMLPFRPGLSLVQAMVEAGGQLPSGDPSALILLRRGQDNTLEAVNAGFTADALRSPDRDILLRPYDVVMLPKSGVAIVADNLNQYLYNLVPFLRNGSVALNYDNVGRR